MSELYLPPQSLDAERCVLGSLLLDNRSYDDISEALLPEHFYSDVHRDIFVTICGMVADGKPFDVVTLAESLHSTGKLVEIGGPAFLVDLLEKVPHAAHVKHYAGIVTDRWEKRELQGICKKTLSALHDAASDTTEVVEDHEKLLFAMADKRPGASAMTIVADDLVGVMSAIDDRMNGIRPGVVMTGFKDIDELTSGFHNGQVVIVGGRPSSGKTAMVCNLSNNFLHLPDCPVAFFSLEQSKSELIERFLCLRTGVNGHDVRHGRISREDRFALAESSKQLAKLPLWIDDTPGRSVAQMSSICRRLKRSSGLGVVIIDYLQLIEPESKKDNREVQVSTISRRLKGLAKELAVPVICLAQLNRGVELRDDKRPRLGDLRESGAIEQDADSVLFLHRPDAYDPEDRPGLAELIVAKNKSGPRGIVNLKWKGASMRFSDWTDSAGTDPRF